MLAAPSAFLLLSLVNKSEIASARRRVAASRGEWERRCRRRSRRRKKRVTRGED